MMNMGENKLDVHTLISNYTKQFQNGQRSDSDLKTLWDDFKNAIENYQGVIEERCGELIEWLEDEEGCSPEVIEEIEGILQSYRENRFFIKNPDSSWEYLSELLKGILPLKDKKMFYVSVPASQLELIIESGRSASKDSKHMRALDTVRKEIRMGKIAKTSEENVVLGKVVSDEEKIMQWINENIPNSPNKKEYFKALEIVYKHPNPKGCTIATHLGSIHEIITPGIGDDSLRKKIRLFLNSLPL